MIWKPWQMLVVAVLIALAFSVLRMSLAEISDRSTAVNVQHTSAGWWGSSVGALH